MKNKKVGCLSLIVIVISVIVIVAAVGGKKDSSEPEKSGIVLEYDTNGGTHCVIYKECPKAYATAAMGAIRKIVDGADTSKLTVDDFTFQQYDDGMAFMTFYGVILDGYEVGGTIYLNFTDKNKKDYEVHYLTLRSDVYLDDGIDRESKYGESQEYLDSLEELE